MRRSSSATSDDWESWNNLGNAGAAAAMSTGGLAALQRAMELNPKSAPVRLNLRNGSRIAGEARRGGAANTVDWPPTSRTIPTPLRELFAMLKSQCRDEEALEAIEEAVRRDPG